MGSAETDLSAVERTSDPFSCLRSIEARGDNLVEGMFFRVFILRDSCDTATFALLEFTHRDAVEGLVYCSTGQVVADFNLIRFTLVSQAPCRLRVSGFPLD
jgi:hypothetical protein